MSVEVEKSTEKLIVEHLKENGQKMSWLAEKLELSSGHLHSVLKGSGNIKRELTKENLTKINNYLGTNFKL